MTPLYRSVPASKRMALFPRQIDGRFHMIRVRPMQSVTGQPAQADRLESRGKLIGRRYPLGMRPDETLRFANRIGWTLGRHHTGLGTMGNYSIGAYLLDTADPGELLARTAEPRPSERSGYVPKVVYSCGAIVHGHTLPLPFGVADNFASRELQHRRPA
jgi:predicted GH43/DUF377 family glycosyl hydrolase